MDWEIDGVFETVVLELVHRRMIGSPPMLYRALGRTHLLFTLVNIGAQHSATQLALVDSEWMLAWALLGAVHMQIMREAMEDAPDAYARD